MSFPVSSFISSWMNTDVKRRWQRSNQTQQNAALSWTWLSFFQSPLKWVLTVAYARHLNWRFNTLTSKAMQFPQHLLDACIRESEEDVNSTNYYVSFLSYWMFKVTTSSTNTLYFHQIEYNFRWLQHPLQNLKADMKKDTNYKPLSALNVGICRL